MKRDAWLWMEHERGVQAAHRTVTTNQDEVRQSSGTYNSSQTKWKILYSSSGIDQILQESIMRQCYFPRLLLTNYSKICKRNCLFIVDSWITTFRSINSTNQTYSIKWRIRRSVHMQTKPVWKQWLRNSFFWTIHNY